MPRLLLAATLGLALLGCSGNSSNLSATTVSTQLADGTELIVLNVPGMT